MGKFKNKLYRFMYGRYGYDTLGKTLLWIYLGIVITYAVISLFVDSALVYVFYLILSTSLVIYTIWRAMSRNIAKRRAENEKFCGFFKLQRNKFRDRKTARYRKCSHCRAIVKLPVKKGKHTVICPRCKGRFDVRI
jgi:hypothetical protein